MTATTVALMDEKPRFEVTIGLNGKFIQPLFGPCNILFSQPIRGGVKGPGKW